MKLFFRKYGQGTPVLILHGLFGLSDNWQTLGKQLAQQFEVYLIDLRNHGLSPHSDAWSHREMSNDLLELMEANAMDKVILLGHSLGGKTAMTFAVQHPEKIEKLIVVDIGTKAYPVHHRKILDALLSVDLNSVQSRKEVEEQLSALDLGTRQFLLKNLYWNEHNKLDWRFNLKVINEKIQCVGEEIIISPDQKDQEKLAGLPVLFVKGERSDYILDSDINGIKHIFPAARLQTVPGAGHWVHADQPASFLECILHFMQHN